MALSKRVRVAIKAHYTCAATGRRGSGWVIEYPLSHDDAKSISPPTATFIPLVTSPAEEVALTVVLQVIAQLQGDLIDLAVTRVITRGEEIWFFAELNDCKREESDLFAILPEHDIKWCILKHPLDFEENGGPFDRLLNLIERWLRIIAGQYCP